MTELTDLNLQEIARALRAGDFSCRELTLAYLERIQRLNKALNAFLTNTPELALKQADQADRQFINWRKNKLKNLHPLLGTPIAIKDVLCLEGIPCTCGSRILENFVPSYSATAVKRLVAAGMIVMGKTNTDEFAMGSSTENSAYGTTRNPWKLDRVPGGSSGGSAAAVAARLSPVALGTDTGGSVRQPASFCGVTGLKPTYGSVSRYGLVAYGSSLDVVGTIGHTVSDVALLYTQIAGYDPLDATTSVTNSFGDDGDRSRIEDFFEPGSGDRVLKDIRVGLPEEYFIEGIQQPVKDAITQAVEQLEELGATIKPVRLPHTDYALPVYYLIAPSEASANLARYDGVRYGARISASNFELISSRTRGQKFGDEVKRRIMLGTYALSAGYYDAYYGQAQKVRTLIREDFNNAFKRVDVIAAPVSPTTAFEIGAHTDDPLAMYLEDILTLPANLAGIPAIAFPVGFDDRGLPIGMQLMAPHFRENILFYLSQSYQLVTDWHTRKPDINREN